MQEIAIIPFLLVLPLFYHVIIHEQCLTSGIGSLKDFAIRKNTIISLTVQYNDIFKAF